MATGSTARSPVPLPSRSPPASRSWCSTTLPLPNPFTTFGGFLVDSNAIIVSTELLGDANLDGKVDMSDLSTLLNHFGQSTPNWTDGNFDYAAAIDLTDLSDLLNNLGQSNLNALSSQLPSTDYQSPTPTPEPHHPLPPPHRRPPPPPPPPPQIPLKTPNPYNSYRNRGRL